MTTTRNWGPIVAEADLIARTYPTSVTLRQLHYRLVASGFGGYQNTQEWYKQLSAHTAEARRAGWFRELSDRTRGVVRPQSFTDPEAAIDYVIRIYRRDRTENQDVQTWVLFEKATLGAQIEDWTWDYGIPTAALRGYSSESLEREIFEGMVEDGRPVVVWYVGDLDPEGVDIERNFKAQAARRGVTFKHWERLTITLAQANAGLAGNFNPGKPKSSRVKSFVAQFGRLFQIEVEALDPARLQQLVIDAITNSTFYNDSTRDESMEQEQADIERLGELRDSA
jgi:hypothetical protein